MKVKKIEQKTYKEVAICDAGQTINPCTDDGCKGELEFTGRVKPMAPPLYTHECSVCAELQNLPHRYPRIITVDIDDQ